MVERFQADGIFAKNPGLNKFLVSPPAVAAGLRIQHGFEVLHGAGACRQMIEEYAALGGDDGLTEKTMRLACGLKERDRRQDLAPGDRLHVADDDAQTVDPSQTVDDGLQVVANFIIGKCVADGRDFYTLKMLRRLALPSVAPNIDRETLWKRLEEAKLFAPVVLSGSKARDSMRPVPAFCVGLGKLIELTPTYSKLEFTELYNQTAFSKYFHGSPCRFTNAELLRDYYTAYLEHLQRAKRGKRSNTEKANIERIQHVADKYKIGESRAESIDKTLSALSQGRSSKRLRCKHSDESKSDVIVDVKMRYHSTLGPLLRTRRHSDATGAQSCPRRVLVQLLPHTIDLDIENAMFTILFQLVQKLQVDMPTDLMETLKQCALHRAEACRDLLRTSIPKGSGSIWIDYVRR